MSESNEVFAMSPEEAESFVFEVKNKLEQTYLDLWKEYASDEPTHLFHYTSGDGLLGIVSTKKFFLTDVLASSDQSEIRHGLDIVKGVLLESRNDPMAESFLASMPQGRLWWGIGDGMFLHAVCFCRTPDALTQWRGYTPGGGFALGVDFKQLMHRADSGDFGLGRMLYARDKQREMVRNTFNCGREFFERLLPIIKTDHEGHSKQALQDLMVEVGICLLKSAVLFKHDAFVSEDEWRVFKLEPFEQLRDKLKFRARGNVITPYFELPFEPCLITEIRCSPGPWSPSALYGVKRLAKCLGDHVQVTQSALPL
jgi:hypothetical protein